LGAANVNRDPHRGARSTSADFVSDPLDWLLQASQRGDVAVVDPHGPITSRAEACATVAVFGEQAIRHVLTDIETFGMPVSISARYELPDTLTKLNSAIFSMTGAQHRARQRLLANLLGPEFADEHDAAIDRGTMEFLAGWTVGSEMRLLTEMRRLASLVAEQVVIGTVDDRPIGAEIQRYFDMRRQYGSRTGLRTPEERDALIDQGHHVKDLLHARVRALQKGADESSVLAHLCRSPERLTEDDLVAHANILFMSSSEPIATAMTWILLGLTQLPELRGKLRPKGGVYQQDHALLVRGVVHEFLRLVPPSAIMVRLTRRKVKVADVVLAPTTEVLISPYTEHRRADVFSDPLKFSPKRWLSEHPSPFQFLPFGNGTRSCLGRRIAMATLERCTSALLAEHDPVLSEPQRLDWLMNVTLMPARDPTIRLNHPGAVDYRAKLSGPAAALLSPET
jgi:cytochrome P450